MLEKIGLPPKPSLRGNSWVVYASHCQGCSSQFTFINRKHHCRRCGGLFCNSCTNQRMPLRGQGDSPVRICDPCKKLEEAVRFEMRHGNKRKGSSRPASKNEDEVLKSILSGDILSHDQQQSFVASSSSHCQELPTKDVLMNETGFITTPEELRQQAMDEKKKHRTLKAEGKSEEALRAFKRGKDLERQAVTLEGEIRKNRKKVSISSGNIPDESSRSVSKKKDDLASELKEMGWSDMDLYESDKKSATMSLEGELSVLLREVSQKPNAGKKDQTYDNSQVIAHKKRALEFKREGKLGEAKEELKKAKLLEKKIEEQEFLIDFEESDDDEISSLIRSLDYADTQEKVVVDSTFDIDDILSVADNLGGDLKVTEDDMDDPEMKAALKSLGWTEEENPDTVDNIETKQTEVQSLKREALKQKKACNTSDAMELLKKAKMIENELSSSVMLGETSLKTEGSKPKTKMMIQKELLSLKRNALAMRREGRLDEADEELKKCKVLENQLEELDNNNNSNNAQFRNNDFIVENDDDNGGGGDEVTDLDLKDPNYLSALKALGWEEDEEENSGSVTPSTSQVKNNKGKSKRSKGEVQKELLSLKRKALSLRRQGESEQAEELLETAKNLEAELAEIESSSLNRVEIPESCTQKEATIIYAHPNAPLDSRSDIITDLVRKEKDIPENKPNEMVNAEKKTSSSLQQEILAHKKKAVAFKREGRLTEAKEELRQAKALEKHLEEETPDFSVPEASSSSDPTPGGSKPLSGRDRFKLQQESLNHKRNAFKLRREGRAEEADAEFKLAKAIEVSTGGIWTRVVGHGSEPIDSSGVHVEDFLDPQLLSALAAIGISDAPEVPVAGKMIDDGEPQGDNYSGEEEKMELEEKVKAEKLKALNLKRSGKHAEALDALRRAKLFERKLISSNSQQ